MCVTALLALAAFETRCPRAPTPAGRSATTCAASAPGATGNTIDSDAINKAILAASAAGGGIVDLPAGRYLSFSLRLKSHVTLRFSPGAVLIAAESRVWSGPVSIPRSRTRRINTRTSVTAIGRTA
jgi:polygalacturonase